MNYERIINYLLDQIEQRDAEIAELIKNKPNQPKTVTKLPDFITTFEQISGPKKDDVSERILLNTLIDKGFGPREAVEYVQKAIQNGQIYERKTGYYQRT
jgi:hypothetical protein